jgi:hypothetical protein
MAERAGMKNRELRILYDAIKTRNEKNERRSGKDLEYTQGQVRSGMMGPSYIRQKRRYRISLEQLAFDLFVRWPSM